MKKLHTLAFAALFAAAPLWAQTPSDESVKRLMELSQIEQNAAAFTQQFMMLQKQQISRLIAADSELTPAQQQQMKEAFERHVDKVTATMQTTEVQSELFARMRPVVQKHFTQEEVDFQIRYLSTPLAQEILRKQPAYLADLMNTSHQLGQEMMQNPKIHQLQQELESEIKKIITTPNKTKEKKR